MEERGGAARGLFRFSFLRAFFLIAAGGGKKLWGGLENWSGLEVRRRRTKSEFECSVANQAKILCLLKVSGTKVCKVRVHTHFLTVIFDTLSLVVMEVLFFV